MGVWKRMSEEGEIDWKRDDLNGDVQEDQCYRYVAKNFIQYV